MFLFLLAGVIALYLTFPELRHVEKKRPHDRRDEDER